MLIGWHHGTKTGPFALQTRRSCAARLNTCRTGATKYGGELAGFHSELLTHHARTGTRLLWRATRRGNTIARSTSLEGRHELPTRRSSAGGLQLPRAVPVLD